MRPALAICLCLGIAGCAREGSVQPNDRSWMGGILTISPYREGSELGVRVRGQWSKPSPDLWIRYRLGLWQEGAAEVHLISASQQLTAFQADGMGVSDYSHAPEFVRNIKLTQPYLAVFDYEIWKGEPTKGELLTKSSVLSEPIQNDSSQ